MSPKSFTANGMMLVGMAHVPAAFYLGHSQGLVAGMGTLLTGLLFFGCGWYLRREFGD